VTSAPVFSVRNAFRLVRRAASAAVDCLRQDASSSRNLEGVDRRRNGTPSFREESHWNA